MRSVASFLLASALLIPAQAGTFSYAGTTVGGPTWNRPIETPFGDPAGICELGDNPVEIPCGGNGLSTNGTVVSYNVLNFAVDISGLYNFNSQQAGAFNGFIFIYQGSFNPTLPINNFLAANNNIIPSNRTQSAINNLNLTAGTSYFFVTTGNTNVDAGTFNNSIQGPGTISAIPEPLSGLGLLLFGAGAIGQLRKRNLQ